MAQNAIEGRVASNFCELSAREDEGMLDGWMIESDGVMSG